MFQFWPYVPSFSFTLLLQSWKKTPISISSGTEMVSLLCLITQSCLTLGDPIDYSPPSSFVYGDSPGKNTEVGCHALLQGIFTTQGSNPGLPHCRWILYHLSLQRNPRILEWVAYPFSRKGTFKWMVHLKLIPDTSKLTNYWISVLLFLYSTHIYWTPNTY